MTDSSARLPGSFRDPSGFLFVRNGSLYRQVNDVYKDDYDRLMTSGLYQTLVGLGWLIPHEEVAVDGEGQAYRVLKPQPVPFVSYPYEWCFGQLRDAALLTLDIQRTALRFGMTLKDGSAYNVQFVGCRPVLIDTLSFSTYHEGQIWLPYRQFCQQFVAPLALMSYCDLRLGQLLRLFVDGIPLDLASRLLPRRTWLRFSLLSHLHLHAATQRRFAAARVDPARAPRSPLSRGQASEDRLRRDRVSRVGLLALIDNLEAAVRRLKGRLASTWADYYEATSYSAAALEHKKALVGQFLDRTQPSSVWDLGANTGLFSRLASDRGIPTVAFDSDPAAVAKNYEQGAQRAESTLLPLVVDLTNPSPGVGWENRERTALLGRGPADLALVLALVHHLAIGNNLPLDDIARFLAGVCRQLIIEFVPKEDRQAQRLLASREDVFADYTQESFERAFKAAFVVQQREPIRDTLRTLYLMARRDGSAGGSP